MAVSKRTRFEVLRRDDHTCRYCGGAAPDVKLTVDHVTPVALGGSDSPDNLVAACRDCNAGKGSTSPDERRVAQVSDDAVRWSAAMKVAAERAAVKRGDDEATVNEFRAVWRGHDFGPEKKYSHYLPANWRTAVLTQLAAGLTMDDLRAAVDVTMRATWVEPDTEFRYFMGVCKKVLAQRVADARAIMNEGSE